MPHLGGYCYVPNCWTPLHDCADWLVNNQASIACIIKHGVKGPLLVNGNEYDIEMLGQKMIQDIELTNIINYINTSWGNNIPTMKNIDVIEQLKKCKH